MVLLTAHDFCQADFALKEKLVFLAQRNPNCLAKETPVLPRRLRCLKRLPGIPSAFPILFLGPTFRFQKTKVGRGVRPFAKMTNGEKRIV
jgi:hypothetical protein